MGESNRVHFLGGESNECLFEGPNWLSAGFDNSIDCVFFDKHAYTQTHAHKMQSKKPKRLKIWRRIFHSERQRDEVGSRARTRDTAFKCVRLKYVDHDHRSSASKLHWAHCSVHKIIQFAYIYWHGIDCCLPQIYIQIATDSPLENKTYK